MYNTIVPGLIPNGAGNFLLASSIGNNAANSPTNPATMSTNLPKAPLIEIDTSSTVSRSIANIIKQSFLEKKSIGWQPIKYEFVANTKLAQEFEQIKSEFRSQAKESIEYEEKYAYLIQSEPQITEICVNGLFCTDSFYNVIGQSKSGVYLCRHSDVAIKYSESKKLIDPLCFKMIVFKICYGKQTLAMVRKDVKLPPIGPTPNFTSHMSVIEPKEKDDIETQFDHSQIYLYELDANKMASKRPRHCVPHVIVTWAKCVEPNWWPSTFQVEEVSFNSVESSAPVNGTVVNASNNEEVKAEEQNLHENDHPQTTEVHDSNAQVESNQQVNESNGTVSNEAGVDENREDKKSNEAVSSAELDSSTQQQSAVSTSSEIGKPDEDTDKSYQQEAITNSDQKEGESEQTKIEQSQQAQTSQVENPETSENQQNISQTVSPSQQPTSSTTPLGVSMSSTNPNSTTPQPAGPPATTTTPTPRPAAVSYPRPTAYSAYRQPVSSSAAVTAAALAPYLYAQQVAAAQFNPYGAAIRLPTPSAVTQAQQLQQIAALQQQQQLIAALQQQAAMAQAPPQQQAQPQVFLCRAPNGMTYLATSGPQVATTPSHQLISPAQNLHAILQQQQQSQAIAQAQALALAQQQQQQQQQQFMFQQQLKLAGLVAQQQQQAIQPQVHAQQIVYQAGPQPPSSASKPPGTQATTANGTAITNTNASQPAPTQSPKQQYNQQQLLYGQPMATTAQQQAANIAIQQALLAQSSNNSSNQYLNLQQQQAQQQLQQHQQIQQQQQIQQHQQIQQQQQLQQHQQQLLAAAGLAGLNGYALSSQTPGVYAGQAQSASTAYQAANGGAYQLVGTAGGLPPGTLQLDQLAGLVRAGQQQQRTSPAAGVNPLAGIRYHPYQRN